MTDTEAPSLLPCRFDHAAGCYRCPECKAASQLPVVPEEVMNIAEDYVLGKVLCGGSVFYRDAAIFARFIVSLGKDGANNGQS